MLKGWPRTDLELMAEGRFGITARIMLGSSSMAATQDVLTALAPMLRVRPELQDYCRFGGEWCAAHAPEEPGWAAFHIVTQGSCVVEPTGQPSVSLEAGDILLLPH